MSDQTLTKFCRIACRHGYKRALLISTKQYLHAYKQTAAGL